MRIAVGWLALLAGCAQAPKRGAEADEWTRQVIRAAPQDAELPPGLRRYSEIRDRLPARRCLEWISTEPLRASARPHEDRAAAR